jgi:hypothetical protein
MFTVALSVCCSVCLLLARSFLLALTTVTLCDCFKSFFHAFPAFGSLSRSYLANKAGAATQMTGFIASMVILVCILFMVCMHTSAVHSSTAGRVVLTCLVHHGDTDANVVLPAQSVDCCNHYCGCDESVRVGAWHVDSRMLVDAPRNVYLHHQSIDDALYSRQMRAWKELFLTLFSLFSTFFLGPELGIVIALSVSVLMVIKHTTIPNVQLLGRTSDGHWRDISENSDASLIPVCVPMHVQLLSQPPLLRCSLYRIFWCFESMNRCSLATLNSCASCLHELV